MGILLRGPTPSILSYHGYSKIFYSLKLFGLFLKEGEGEVLKVKLGNLKACNEECHSVLRIHFLIIYYSPLKTNSRAIFFLPCEVGR